MGSYSPAPAFSPALQDAAMDGIIRPALAEMARRGTPFRGILYAGLMLTAEGVKLIEFNVRFGDPECQALVLRLKSDLLPALQAAYDGELKNFDLRWNDDASIAVVMAAPAIPRRRNTAAKSATWIERGWCPVCRSSTPAQKPMHRAISAPLADAC